MLRGAVVRGSGADAGADTGRVARAGSIVETSPAPILHKPIAGQGGNRRRMLASILVAVVFLAAVTVAGIALGEAATATDFGAKNLAPSLEHPFGTDWMGRDMLTRTLAGLATSVGVGLASSACSAVLALALALVSTLGGRAADAVVQWAIDLVMGIPHIVLLILVSYALGRGTLGVTVAVAVTHWPSLARVLRAEAKQLSSAPWMQTSRALGAGRAHLALSHVLPALLPQLIVGAVLAFPHAVLHEASITFLGFGLGSEQPAIGVILSESMSYLTSGCWWLAVFPGAALLLVVLAADRAGSTLRRLTAARSVQE